MRAVAAAAPRPRSLPVDPSGIFVLRNNDLGDLIIVTPLFDALRRRFPKARIVVGVGAWNPDVLLENPHVDEVLVVKAPWHNKYLSLPPDGRPSTLLRNDLRAARYLLGSDEVAMLRARSFDVGIDVLGSPWGSLLLMRAGIPHRLGVRGYEGGHSGMQEIVQFDHREHVGRTALRFAELLGATDLPPLRPQLFLRADELDQGEAAWRKAVSPGRRALRVIIAPGGGLPEKCWPLERFQELARVLTAEEDAEIIVVGGPADREDAAKIAASAPGTTSLAGDVSLRQTFALLATADAVICNASMVMHAAAAFEIPTVVVLSQHFVSADEHDKQWGYPTGRSIGRESERDSISTVADVLETMRQITPKLSARAGANAQRAVSGAEASGNRAETGHRAARPEPA